MAISTLLCHAHEDKDMAAKLERHLSSLKHNGSITLKSYGNIQAGPGWKEAMSAYLDEAQMILLLISDSFLASDYCYSMQMQQAIKLHEAREACVIPIIMRYVHWEDPPLDKLQVLPEDGKPIAGWTPQDKGFTNVVKGIATVVKQWNEHSLAGPTPERKAFMADFDQFVARVRVQLQPPPRAEATANTLQQLSVFVPKDVTLADLLVGWRALSHSSQTDEPATAQRRITCGELADIAAQITPAQGDLKQAIKTWHAWRDAFQKSDDPRQNAMTMTFARELSELQDVGH